MVARGLPAPSLSATGGSALTNSWRPVGSETLAIWAPARRAKKLAQRTSVPRRSPAVIAVRFTIVPRGRQTTILQPDTKCTVFDIARSGSMYLTYYGPLPNGLP